MSRKERSVAQLGLGGLRYYGSEAISRNLICRTVATGGPAIPISKLVKRGAAGTSARGCWEERLVTHLSPHRL